MKIVKLYLCCQILIGLTLLSSCKKDKTDDNVTVKASQYYPLSIGNTWKYNIYDVDNGEKFLIQQQTYQIDSLKWNSHIINIFDSKDSTSFGYIIASFSDDATAMAGSTLMYKTNRVHENDTTKFDVYPIWRDSTGYAECRVYYGERETSSDLGIHKSILVRRDIVNYRRSGTHIAYYYDWFTKECRFSNAGPNKFCG